MPDLTRGSGQRHRRLRHTSTAGRPNAGRSTSVTDGQSSLDARPCAAARAAFDLDGGLDVNPQLPAQPVLDSEDTDLGQAHGQGAAIESG